MDCISEEYFPGYSEETTKKLCEFLHSFEEFVNVQVSNYEIHLSLICAFVNIFHITVLLQKSMRTSSIHLIMAAIAFTDLLSLTYAIQRDMILFYHDTDLCYSKTTDYYIVLMQMICDYVRNYTRRCSTWLSLSITLVRALVLQYPTNARIKKLSSTKAACFIVSGIITMVISLNILEVFRYEVTVFDENYECGEDLYYFRYYWYDISNLFQTNDIFENVYKRIDAIVSKMIPCVLFPIATFVLIRGIRKANYSRQKMVSNSAAKNHANTSYLVLAQTLTFFIAEIPLGIVFMMESLYDSDQFGKQSLLVNFEIFFSFVLAGTTATHMIICVLMSTQYRSSALMLLRLGYPDKPKKKFVALSWTGRNQS
ncbi:unnamed protein product [Caenorhabditis brenneri]